VKAASYRFVALVEEGVKSNKVRNEIMVADNLCVTDHFLTTAARRFNLAFTAWAFSDLHIYTTI